MDEHPGLSNEPEKIERLKRAMYSRSLSSHIKDRQRRDLDDTPPLVGNDWVRPEPVLSRTTVAPGGIAAMRIVLRLLLGSAIAFFIGAAGFFAYYFTLGGGSSPASPGNIDISISGPLQITSGEPAELQISVTNRNQVPLELADLVVSYPPGTRSPTDLLTDVPNQRISLGTIEPGGRRQGTVSAVFAGSEGARAAVRAQLEYRLSGSSAIFVASSDYDIMFASSPLSIAIEGNHETIAGQPIEFVVTVTSNATAPVKDVLLSAGLPFGFTLSSSEPKALAGTSNVFSIGDLAPGAAKTLRLRGVLSGESGDERVFRFTAGVRKEKTDQTISTIFADYAHHVTVSRPFLGLAVLVNRDAGGGTVVAPGDTVNISVAWQNNLPTAVTDAVIVARLSGIEIDGATVRSNDGFYRSSDNAVLWDKSTTNGSLATLSPGAKGTVSFSFQMPPSETIKVLRDPKLDITVHAAGKRVSESSVPESLQSTAMQTLKVASDLQLVAQGLYYSNPFGSTGPMPPKAGQETTYAIVFSVTNTTNRVTSAKVKALLPPYVRWSGIYSPSSEKLTFNQNDSSVTWDVGTIEPGVGVNGSTPRQAAIAIGFTPSTSQIGQQPPLVRSIILTGRDGATGAEVSKTAADVTTSIVGDPGFSAANATVVR